MKAILLGAPGSGKGTQAELLAKKCKIPAISTGDILRHAVAVGGALGKRVEAYLKKGNLVPDKLVDQIVQERIKHKDCRHGFILDGFPRDIAQAKDLEKLTNIDFVLDITIPEEVVIRRISNRRVCIECGEPYNLVNNPPKKQGICDECRGKLIHREDDKEATIRHRLKVYKKQTEPLIEYYSKKGILRKVNGYQHIKKVFSDICKILKK